MIFINRPVKLEYPKGVNPETGIANYLYRSGMARISESQFQIIFQKMIEANLNQLIL